MFGAWSYHTSKMNLTNMDEKINTDSYKPNGEWEIVNTEVSYDTKLQEVSFGGAVISSTGSFKILEGL